MGILEKPGLTTWPVFSTRVIPFYMNQPSFQSDEPTGAERRRVPRIAVDAPIQWRPQGEREWHDGLLIDLSVAGAAFSAREKLNEGHQVSLRIIPPESVAGGRPIVVSGTVANIFCTEDGISRYGVEFERMFFVFADWMAPQP